MIDVSGICLQHTAPAAPAVCHVNPTHRLPRYRRREQCLDKAIPSRWANISR